MTELGDADAGEMLTLQRAAFLSEAIVYGELAMAPLHQTLEELRTELADPAVIALGVREGGRLLGATRVRLVDRVAHLGRLTVVPDRQGEGVGSALLDAADGCFAEAEEIRLFTGERSFGNLRLYGRHGYAEVDRSDAGSFVRIHLAKRLD